MREAGAGEGREHQGKGIVARSGWRGQESQLWESARATADQEIQSKDGKLYFEVADLDDKSRARLAEFYMQATPSRVKELLEELARVRLTMRELARAVREHPDLGSFMVASFMRDDFDDRLHGALLAAKAVSHEG
jgi:hypothetical protein